MQVNTNAEYYLMKSILLFLLQFFITVTCYCQVISYQDFKSIIPFVQTEDFKAAFERSAQLLSSTENDSSDLRGIVTYMNIFSAAGMVSTDQMTHSDFLKNANGYKGQRIVMSAHPCIDSTAEGYNSLKFITAEGQQQGMTITANTKKTSVLCFEYFKYADNIQPSGLIGRNVRCGGILDSVEVNPNGSKVWISRLHVVNAFAREMTAR